MTRLHFDDPHQPDRPDPAEVHDDTDPTTLPELSGPWQTALEQSAAQARAFEENRR